MNVGERLKAWQGAKCDIQGHLQYIYEQSGGLVLELGVRSGASTSALLSGVECNGGHLFSVDRNHLCADVFRGHDDWTFIESWSTDEEVILGAIKKAGFKDIKFDIIFLDTEHTYEQVYQEISIWHPYLKEGGKILIHDVETYFKGAGDACRYFAYREKWDLTIRSGWNGLGILTRKEKQK